MNWAQLYFDLWGSLDPVLRGSVSAFLGSFAGVTVAYLLKR